jgi:hypothetical protein
VRVSEPLIIERGIPMPPARGSRKGQRDGWAMNPITVALRSLEVGDSVFIPKPSSHEMPNFNCNISARARNVGRACDPQRLYATRRVAGGVRVWRIA